MLAEALKHEIKTACGSRSMDSIGCNPGHQNTASAHPGQPGDAGAHSPRHVENVEAVANRNIGRAAERVREYTGWQALKRKTLDEPNEGDPRACA